MILCFLLSVNSTATAASSGLIRGEYSGKSVFYRKTPTPIVTFAKDEPEASGYIEKIEDKTTSLDDVSSTLKGDFSIVKGKSIGGGQLVIFQDGRGPSIKRYKAFINNRAAIGNIKPTDLRYFADLFDSRDNDKIVKWIPASIAVAATNSNPQPTAEEKQDQIRNLKQEIVNIKQAIQAIRLASESQSYVTSIQQQKEVSSKLNPDTVEQTPEALAAAREILENTKTKIMEMNEGETSRLIGIEKKIMDLIATFIPKEYRDPNQTERLVNYTLQLKERNPDVAFAILKIIGRNKKIENKNIETIDNILKAVNLELSQAGYPQLAFDLLSPKYLRETGVFSSRNILGKDDKL